MDAAADAVRRHARLRLAQRGQRQVDADHRQALTCQPHGIRAGTAPQVHSQPVRRQQAAVPEGIDFRRRDACVPRSRPAAITLLPAQPVRRPCYVHAASLAIFVAVIEHRRLDHRLCMGAVIHALDSELGLLTWHELIRGEVMPQPLDEHSRQIGDIFCFAPYEVVLQHRNDLVVRLAVVRHIQPADDARTRRSPRRG